MLRRAPGAAEDAEHLLARLVVLPLRVRGEHRTTTSSTEQHRRGLNTGEVEELALPDHVVGGDATAALAVLHVRLQRAAAG